MKSKKLDRDQIIKLFAKEFVSIFPNIYTEKDIIKKLTSDINYIVKKDLIDQDNKVAGRYNKYNKTVLLTSEEFNKTTFHELVHVMTNNFASEKFPNFVSENPDDSNIMLKGIVEAYTDFAADVYDLTKKTGNHQKYFNFNNGLSISSYDKGVMIAQQLELLFEMQTGRSLLEEFLKGSDIRRELFDFFEDSLIKNSNLELKQEILHTSALYVYYYCIMFDQVVTNEDVNDELFFLLQRINKNFFANQDIELQKAALHLFNNILINDIAKVDLAIEQKLLAAIFGSEAVIKQEEKESIEDIMSDYINTSERIQK